MTGATSETVEFLEEELMKDIKDGSKTGMRPFSEIRFSQIPSSMVDYHWDEDFKHTTHLTMHAADLVVGRAK